MHEELLRQVLPPRPARARPWPEAQAASRPEAASQPEAARPKAAQPEATSAEAEAAVAQGAAAAEEAAVPPQSRDRERQQLTRYGGTHRARENNN